VKQRATMGRQKADSPLCCRLRSPPFAPLSGGIPVLQNVTVETCLAFALETEALGASLYQELANKFASDGELKELFEELGRDEVRHGEQLREMGAQLGARIGGRPLPEEEQAYLRAMSMSEVFSQPGGIGDLAGFESRAAALKRALHLEKATLGYYQAMREVLGPEKVLDSIIALERKHVVLVTARLVTQTLLGGLADSA
jgi:rubrerythrin